MCLPARSQSGMGSLTCAVDPTGPDLMERRIEESSADLCSEMKRGTSETEYRLQPCRRMRLDRA
jgi:hypothetical protein